MNIEFTKFHGNSNDFIIIENKEESYIIPKAAELCNRKSGIGADGILLLNKADDRYLMSIINSDGSVAKNCGNGLRCAASFIFAKYKISSTKIDLFGVIYHCKKVGEKILVEMGVCTVFSIGTKLLNNKLSNVFKCNIGNEHIVYLFDEQVEDYESIVKEILLDSVNKNYNIGVLCRDKNKNLISRVYERGSLWTDSCGTGACAAASVVFFTDKNMSKVKVNQPGGEIEVALKTINQTNNHGEFYISQRGEAVSVFNGRVEL